MINDSMNYKRITIFAKDTQNDMKRFIGHTILILLAEIFLFCPITMSQNNPYKINDQLYSYYQKCNSAIRKPEVLLMADTLFHMAKKKGDVKAQCLALNLKSDHYYFINDINTLLIEKEKVADFARNTPYKQYIFGAWNRIITYYLRNREYDSAIQELKKYQDEAIRLDNPYGIGKSYVRMGDVYYQQRMFRLALQQYKQAVDYYIQTGNEKENFYSYRSISSCYINLQRYEEAEEYALRCLDASVTQSALIQSKLLLFQVTCSKMDSKKADELQKELAQYRAQGVMKGTILENYFTLNGYYYAALGNLDKALAYSDSISDKGLSLAVRYKAFEMAGDFYSAFAEL
ncbi:tetratricopeptide repeat protein [Phocaeicola massiliensis]|nr:tetratricopeptide repeat protein [Phocaeicola massiliensis]